MDIAALDATWPPRFGIYDHSLYYPANVGRLAELGPRGGFAANNDMVLHGVDQAFAVLDKDTPPDGHLTLTLSATKGFLSLNSVDGLTFVTGDGFQDESLVIRGTVSALNMALRDLRYLPHPGATGWDTVQAVVQDSPLECGLNATHLTGVTPRNASSCDDGVRHEVEGDLRIYITAVNDPPTIQVPHEVWTVKANSWTELAQGALVVSDSDMEEAMQQDDHGNFAAPPMTVSLATERGGRLRLHTFEGLAFVEGDGNEDMALTMVGSITSINQALDGLEYRCKPGARAAKCAEESSDRITIQANDNGYSGRGGALSASAFFDVDVVASDDSSGMSESIESEVYPAGTLSWHDVHDGYQALPEERKQTRFGDGDFWDD
uniref:Uncharacterized protein n=1 Tax=Rhizochromulina marina TaxID=1034831 RepID=A0A7S2STP8_9STRA